ncbi:MAG: peptidylprolyl isomerase [Elusimicrobiota bacterium]
MASLLAPVVLLLGSLSCRRFETDEVVARVGKSAITQSEFRRKLEEVAPGYQDYVLTPHGRRQFLDVLIREKLIIEAARADGVDGSPEFKDRMIQLRKEEEEKIREARDYLLARLWLDRLREKGVIGVTDDEVRDFHRRHDGEVVARHILLATAAEAEAVLKRIRLGASFAQEAKMRSLDADTAGQGGRMSPALYGEILPDLGVLFKMGVGELGGPVRSTFGYHVLLKEGARKVPLHSSKDRIRSILEKQKLDRHLQSLQASYRVEVVDAQLE